MRAKNSLPEQVFEYQHLKTLHCIQNLLHRSIHQVQLLLLSDHLKKTRLRNMFAAQRKLFGA